MTYKNRNRLVYAILIVLIIIAGLMSRHFAGHLPAWNKLYAGDALWALMVFLIVGFLFKRKPSSWVAMVALIFAFCIEFSQIYHAPWIDSIRATRLGGLVLGFGFMWSDLLCYTIGIAFGFLVEKIYLRK